MKFIAKIFYFNILKIIFFVFEIYECFNVRLKNSSAANNTNNNVLRNKNYDSSDLININNVNNDNRKQDFIISTHSYEFTTLRRNLQFYISKLNDCNVFINDTVTFRKEYSSNFIEHWILHNNVEEIYVKEVTSSEIKIKFFSFNKKLNSFTVYFDDSDNNFNKEEFSINFQYDTKNLIKSNIASNYDLNYFNQDSLFVDDFKSDLDEENNLVNYDYNYNNIIWKIFNKNYQTTELEFLYLEINFNLGEEFKKYKIISKNPYFKFNKEVKNFMELKGEKLGDNFNILNIFNNINENSGNINNEIQKENTIVKFLWKGPIHSEEVLVLDIQFPLYFENCKNSYMSMFVILIGTVFIIFIIFMLYVVFSTVIFNEI